MSDAPRTPEVQPPAPEKRNLGADLIIPAGTILFAIYYLYTIWGLPWQATAAGLGIAAAMAMVLALLAARFIREYRAGQADLGFGALAFPVGTQLQRIGLLLAVLGFVYIMPFLGFTPSLFLFLVSGIVILSGVSHLKAGILISLAVSLGGYLLFIVFVGARFPRGPVETLLGSLF